MISAANGEIYLKLGPSGLKDGEAWDDGCGGDVKQICVCHGDQYIYSIQTTYERHGNTLVSDRHGGTKDNYDVISFNEPLTWVSGHYKTCEIEEPDPLMEDDPSNYTTFITSLKFGTDRAIYGPFGEEKGKPFRYSSSTGICGFHGYCWNGDSGILKAVGVYVRAMAVRRINNNDPILTMATPALPVISPPLQDMVESNETSIIRSS